MRVWAMVWVENLWFCETDYFLTALEESEGDEFQNYDVLHVILYLLSLSVRKFHVNTSCVAIVNAQRTVGVTMILGMVATA